MNRNSDAMAKLKNAWLLWSLLFLSGLIGSGWLINRIWDLPEFLGWIILSGSVAVFQLVTLRSHLGENHAPGKKVLNARFGLANWFSIVRGGLLAFLFGFAAGPWPVGWMGWVPGVLYLTASIMDFMDGYLARITAQETVLGERLDMSLDGMGVLAGSWVAIHFGQLPVWFLLIGLARYFFIMGGKLVERGGRTLRPLRPNPFRRALAGAQMGFIAVILLPIFYPPVTKVAAVFFAAPFLVNFLLDWFWVSGVIPERGLSLQRMTIEGRKRLKWLIPLLFRLGLSASILWALIDFKTHGWVWAALLTVLVGVCFGVAGRTMALGAVLISGWLLQQSPANAGYWLQLSFGAVVFFFGTGAFSFWSPEDWLIYHRAGDKSSL